MNTKQTEIGEIPENWEVVKLGDLLKPSIRKESLSSNEYVSFIGMQDVSENAELINQTPMLFSDVKKGLTSFIRNDVLVAKITPCFENGKGCYTENLKTEVGVGSTEFHVLRANDLADGKFVYFWTVQQSFREILTQEMVGSAGHKRVPFSSIQKFQIPLPSLPEQTAIATILSDTDRLLAALRALIGKKRAVKTAAMQQLLSGSLRLPEFATNGSLKNSELGEIPEDWEVVKIGEFTDCTAGGTPSTAIPEYWNGDIPWMSSGELHLKQVYDVSGRITELGLDNSSTSIVPEKSVLIGLAGQGKTRGTVAISRIPLCTNQSIAAVFPSNLFCSEYLFYNLENRYEELRSLSTGDGGRGGLNLTIIRSLAVPFPSLPEQTAIALTLSDMDSEIAALEARAAKLAQIKQGLMQNLLTGKIRVNTGAA